MAGASTTSGSAGGQDAAAALPLSLAMRRHTRKIHRRSDALVNLKLALAFTDRALYARAIALFQPIYERLEALLPKAAQKEPALRPLVELVLSGPSPLARSKAFETDLAFLLGPDWRRTALPNPQPAALETYLARLEEAPPVLLAVYAFHMYNAAAAVAGGDGEAGVTNPRTNHRDRGRTQDGTTKREKEEATIHHRPTPDNRIESNLTQLIAVAPLYHSFFH